jgi:hypothetical protein
VRLLTIPIEDCFYNLGMLLTTTLAYEWLRARYRDATKPIPARSGS